MKPFYDDGTCVIYHGTALNAPVWPNVVVVTDPPYGIGYQSNQPRLDGNSRSIVGDDDTSLRDDLLSRYRGTAALVFGSPKSPEPDGVRARLIWDQDGALGMGDLSLPWKPSWQFIYVLGGPWAGRRDCGSVYRYPPVQSVARHHPHQKPVGLMHMLLEKCPPSLCVLDPFMGSGTTLRAAKDLGRKAIGIEIEERYCEIAAKRLAQEVLPL